MITVPQVEVFFSYFHERKYGAGQKFRTSKTTEGYCDTFLKLLHKEYNLHCVGNQFLWDYFLFQFNYWHELNLQNGFSDKIVIAWIVGKKAFKRWTQRDKEFDWAIDKSEIIEAYGLDQKYLFRLTESLHEKPQTKIQSVPFDSSKRIRKEYLNTDKGFAICIEQTTLFDPKDFSCLKCNNRTDCKELLRVNYPTLFKQRIHE